MNLPLMNILPSTSYSITGVLEVLELIIGLSKQSRTMDLICPVAILLACLHGVASLFGIRKLI